MKQRREKQKYIESGVFGDLDNLLAELGDDLLWHRAADKAATKRNKNDKTDRERREKTNDAQFVQDRSEAEIGLRVAVQKDVLGRRFRIAQHQIRAFDRSVCVGGRSRQETSEPGANADGAKRRVVVLTAFVQLGVEVLQQRRRVWNVVDWWRQQQVRSTNNENKSIADRAL